MLFLVPAFAISCGGGGGSSASTAYTAQVESYKANYGMSDAWEDWMIENSTRYEATFAASSAKPNTITISYRYDTDPESTFETDWVDEADHMTAFSAVAEGAYPGYNFNFEFESSTTASYANVTAGIAINLSRAGGKEVLLYHEGIFNHEFAHIMLVQHHYTDDDTSEKIYLPPGETECIMARNSTMFCSACRMALGITLDDIDTTAMDAAWDELSNHSSR